MIDYFNIWTNYGVSLSPQNKSGQKEKKKITNFSE
jgi:hypothetical protein